MPNVLCFNPGSNSLKFDIIGVDRDAARACEGQRLLSGTIDNVGKETSFELRRGEEKILSQHVLAGDFSAAVRAALDSLAQVQSSDAPTLDDIDLTAVRVVHGGSSFTQAVRFDSNVRKVIEANEELAPLHNANSLRVIDAVQQRRSSIPIAVAFDTAFHHTLPERAWRYPIDRTIADRHGIRKFGFHGLSHCYQMERYAGLTGKRTEDVSIVTMHLESGCSATAIQNGRSVETSMGLTPLEGLMMGERSGSIDPAILPFLMKKEGLSPTDALDILETKSGLLGVSGVSLDTRVLRKRDDQHSRLALEIFGYRLRQTIAAYLAVLESDEGSAEAIVFGGGIGENTPEVRSAVCEGLRGWGLVLNNELNRTTMRGDVRISTADSKVAIWAIHADEAMQLAYECVKVGV